MLLLQRCASLQERWGFCKTAGWPQHCWWLTDRMVNCIQKWLEINVFSLQKASPTELKALISKFVFRLHALNKRLEDRLYCKDAWTSSFIMCFQNCDTLAYVSCSHPTKCYYMKKVSYIEKSIKKGRKKRKRKKAKHHMFWDLKAMIHNDVETNQLNTFKLRVFTSLCEIYSLWYSEFNSCYLFFPSGPDRQEIAAPCSTRN